jgi:ERCC4-type nuclease
MSIKVDYREKVLYAQLIQKLDNIELINLDLGDIQIHIDDQIQIIFERKTISDLNQSIKDGRYHEQKARLVSNFKRNRIIYILEGAMPLETSKYIDKNIIYSSMLHTIFRDGIFFYRTTGVEDTSNFIYELYTRFIKNKEEWISFLNGNNYQDALEPDIKVFQNTKKSDNITPNVSYINMLSQIPGCSTKIAKEISLNYNSMALLLQQYLINDKPEQLLKDIKLENRKIGPILSKRIYHFLFNINTIS